MINKKRIIEPNRKKSGVNSNFSGGVHVNGDVTSDIYFIYTRWY